MRVLFTCIQGFGHFHPMVPLARALEKAGHTVAFASAGRFAPRITEAGFEAFAAGMDLGEVHQETCRRPEVAALARDDLWSFGAHMFAAVAGPAKVDDLSKLIATFSADLVVNDPTDFAGPLAAASSGVPWVGHGFGALPPERFCALAGELSAPAWRERGLEPAHSGGMFGQSYVDICPPSFQRDIPLTSTRVQLLRAGAGDIGKESRPPEWIRSLRPLPTVYVTLGTIDNHAPGVFETVLGGLDHDAVNLIVTVGPSRDPAELGPQPDGVRVERYIPQSLILPSCDAVICHGGSGTTLAALAHGLPVLALPQSANQFWNAERCSEIGVGIQMLPSELGAGALAGELHTLLHEASFRNRAAELRAEIEAMPTPEDVVAHLQGLVGDSRGLAESGRPAAAVGPRAPVAPEIDGADPVIRTRGLTKVYHPAGRQHDVVAVDNLDLDVARGEIFGLLGPNGAGKTTTVGMLTTRVRPTSGEARVSGIDVTAEPALVKQLIGVVPQANTLDRSLTVHENLYFHGRYFGMSAKMARIAADDLLERFRLTARAKAEVYALSGGMAQRLMVARAVLHKPAVLFLDEPTAGLDPQSRLALWEIVAELHAVGQTILLTTHYMEEADQYCDRVAIVDHGRILALDTPTRLKQLSVDGTGADGSGEEITLETVFIELTGRELRE